MSRPNRILLLTAAFALGWADAARAGMPAVHLTDVARLRVQNISFFLAVLLLSAWAVRGLWNYLRRDFHRLPRLSYGRALGLVGLWGLLFVLVLTMISGARELMTPGAWKKEGLTYQLARPPAPAPPDPVPTDPARRSKLDGLRIALWEYADAHGGRFPPDRDTGEIPRERWQLPGPARAYYGYAGGRKAGEGTRPLAFEPDIFGPRRLVLLANGEVREMTNEAIEQALATEGP